MKDDLHYIDKQIHVRCMFEIFLYVYEIMLINTL